tara:strand:+ start:751 stop:1032 length:282 start_codon:yes stop_codon:yes gene_type:complete
LYKININLLIRKNNINSPEEADPRIISHLLETDAHIPIDITKKYTVNSNGDLTGFLNLTIDRAPTRPRDNAKLLDITEVTEYVMIGNKNIDNV